MINSATDSAANRRTTLLENLSPNSCILYPFFGNVLFVSDTSGNINTSYVQERFGNVLATNGSADNNYNLTTKEQDSNTGLYYFNARWYDPGVGRFISKDPLCHLQSNNLNNIGISCPSCFKPNFQSFLDPYVYADNNPITHIDPQGLSSRTCCIHECLVIQLACSIACLLTGEFPCGLGCAADGAVCQLGCKLLYP